MSVGNRKSKRGEETEHFTARVETRLLEVLRARAAENDRSVSAELRQILRDAFREAA